MISSKAEPKPKKKPVSKDKAVRSLDANMAKRKEKKRRAGDGKTVDLNPDMAKAKKEYDDAVSAWYKAKKSGADESKVNALWRIKKQKEKKVKPGGGSTSSMVMKNFKAEGTGGKIPKGGKQVNTKKLPVGGKATTSPKKLNYKKALL